MKRSNAPLSDGWLNCGHPFLWKRVYVYKAEKVHGHRVQLIKIIYKCIGEFTLPDAERDENTAHGGRIGEHGRILPSGAIRKDTPGPDGQCNKVQTQRRHGAFWVYSGDKDSSIFRQRLIGSFVNAAHVYDDGIIVTCNYRDRSNVISLAEVRKALGVRRKNGSDLKAGAPPRQKVYREVSLLLCICILSTCGRACRAGGFPAPTAAR